MVAQKKKTSEKSSPKKKKEKKSKTDRIRVKLRAYDHKVIDKSAHQIVEAVLRCGAEVSGPIPLPTEIHKYTVNRSTFVHEKSKDQYEMRVHKRLIDILNPTPEVLDTLMNLTLPSGVDIEIKT